MPRRPQLEQLAPFSNDPQRQVSRRSLLAFAAALPLLPVLGVNEDSGPQDGLVMHAGWVLRADDLERLAIA